jgi:Tfp pilus assembly protein PilF
VKKKEDQQQLMAGLVNAYDRLGESAKAKVLLEEMAKAQPRNLSLRVVLFNLALLSENQAEMKKQLTQLKNIEGDSGVFWRYGEAGKLVAQARPMMEKATEKWEGQKLLREARLHLDRAGALHPSWHLVPALLGEIDALEGKTDAALDKLNQARTLGDQRPESVRLLARMLLKSGRTEELTKLLDKLDKEQALLSMGLGQLGAIHLLARKDLTAPDSDRALDLFVRATPPNSTSYTDHLWLGRVHWHLGQKTKDPNRQTKLFEEAEKSLRKACALKPGAAETWVALIGFLTETNHVDQARKVIEDAKQQQLGEHKHLILASCYVALGDRKEAEKQIETAVIQNEKDPETLRSAAQFYLLRNQVEKAQGLLFDLMNSKTASLDDVIWARRHRAANLAAKITLADFKEALKLIKDNLDEKANTTKQDDRRVLARLLATRTNSHKAAITEFEDLAVREGERFPANDRYVLAQLYRAQGEWEKAKGQMAVLMGMSEGKANPAYRAEYARWLIKKGDVAQAQKQFEEMQKAAPEDPLTKEIDARVKRLRNEDREAVALLKKFAQTKGAEVGKVALLLEELAEGANSKELYLKAAEELLLKYMKPKGHPERLLVRAQFLARRHSLRDALADCEKVIKKVSPEVVGLIMTAILRECKAQTKGQECQRVEKILTEALDGNKDSIALRLALADLYDYQEHFDKAASTYLAALQIDDSNLMALNNLAWLKALHQKKPMGALALIDQAIKLVGETPELLDTRAVIYLTMRTQARALQAVNDLESVISQTKEPKASQYFHLAWAYWRAGKRKEFLQKAEENFKKAEEKGLNEKNVHPLEQDAFNELASGL